MQEGTAGPRPGRTGKQDRERVPVQGVPLQGGRGSRPGQPADLSLEEAATRVLGEEQSMAGNWRQPALKQGRQNNDSHVQLSPEVTGAYALVQAAVTRQGHPLMIWDWA